jgi:hypothetical protein
MALFSLLLDLSLIGKPLLILDEDEEKGERTTSIRQVESSMFPQTKTGKELIRRDVVVLVVLVLLV